MKNQLKNYEKLDQTETTFHFKISNRTSYKHELKPRLPLNILRSLRGPKRSLKDDISLYLIYVYLYRSIYYYC